MITRVVLTAGAQKDLASVPEHIARKFHVWVDQVALLGLEEVRKQPGWHDEPLRGKRAGQRSIRLNQAYRAIYRIDTDATGAFVLVLEVNKHKY